MNAKEYNIVVTVVCKLKIKTEPQLSDQTKMPISQQHGARRESNSAYLRSSQSCQCPSTYISKNQTKTNPKNKTNLFLH